MQVCAPATRRITGSLIGTMGIVTLLPFVQLDGLWKCIYDTFPGAAAAFNAASFHIELIRLEIYIFRNCIEGVPQLLVFSTADPTPAIFGLCTHKWEIFVLVGDPLESH